MSRCEAERREVEYLSRQLSQLRADVKRAREWAGDNLPAAKGLAMVTMLEKAMRGA